LNGAGIGFALLYLFYTGMMWVVVRRLTGFGWSHTCLKILCPAIFVIGAVFACTHFLSEIWSVCVGLAVTLSSATAALVTLQKLLKVNLWQVVRRKFLPESV
jgi:PST family polysaccharide transporter